MKRLLCLLVLLVVYATSLAQITCRVEGRIINRDENKQLIIYDYLTDPYINNGDTIDIKDGTFHYELTVKEPLVYRLIFVEALGIPFEFCPADSVVKITLFDDDISAEGIVRNTYKPFYDSVAQEMRKKIYLPQVPQENQLTAKAKEFIEVINNAESEQENDSLMIIWYQMLKSKEAYSDDYKEYLRVSDSIQQEIEIVTDKFETANPSIFTYCRLVAELQWFDKMSDPKYPISYYVDKFHSIYETRYPEHTYTKMCENLINNLTK